MITTRLELWRKYFTGAAWTTAFEFLETLGPDSAPQDYVSLQGDAIFARIMQYPTRTPAEAIVEAHRKYIDIQMSLLHSERIRWYDLASLCVKTPYNDKTDAEFYETDAVPLGQVENHPGIFSVYFPEDPHMPQLSIGAEPVPVLKVVVKVQVDLVR